MIRSKLSQRLGIALIVLVVLTGAVAGASTLFTAGGGTAYETGSGLVVTTSVDHDLNGSNPFVGSNGLHINNVTFSASGTSELTVDQFLGSETQLSSIDASTSAITVDPSDKDSVTISGGVTDLDFDDVQLDRTSQLTYSASSSGTITVRGLATNTEFVAATAGGTVLSNGTTTSSGEATISVSSGSNEEIVLYEPVAPEIDNGAASPADGGQVSQRDVNLSIPISDVDFGHGDSVTVDFYLDGSKVATKNISSNSTVSTTQTVSSGGEHEWYVEAVDAFGQSQRSDANAGTAGDQNFTFTNAATLRVFNESAPDELVNSTTVDVTFFGDGETTETRSATDGVIDFAGLPLDEEFIIRVQAQGYRDRTIFIPSLLEQERVYLLPENANSVQVRFTLDDVTGTFSQDSTLFIEKPITINNQTDYQIIVSDQFGVDGVTTNLEQGVRYELRIRNQQGTTAQLSAYDAEVSESVVLQPSAASVQRPQNQAIGYEINYDQPNDKVTVEYVDPAELTDSLTVSIKSRDGSHVLKSAQTYSDANALSLSVPTNGTLNQTYLVNVTADRNGEQIKISEPIGPRQEDLTPDGLGGYTELIGAMIILLIGGTFSMLNVGVGAMVTSLLGGVLWYFGFMGGLASGAAVSLAIGIATLNLINQTR